MTKLANRDVMGRSYIFIALNTYTNKDVMGPFIDNASIHFYTESHKNHSIELKRFFLYGVF